VPPRTTSGLDATLAPGAVPQDGLFHFSPAQDFLLNDDLWGDWGLGFNGD